MKTVSTLRPREKEISVFLIDKDDVKKIGEVDRVSVSTQFGIGLMQESSNVKRILGGGGAFQIH